MSLEELQGVGLGELINGAAYLRVHYTADPTKRDPEWATRSRKEMGVRFWDQQMEMSEEIFEGEPVYPDYNDDIHCPKTPKGSPVCPRTGKSIIVRDSMYVCGWDAGTTVQPAAVLLQITPANQVHAILEIVPDKSEPMSTFAPRVMMGIQKMLPHSWAKVHHVGDNTITSRAGATGDTARSVAKNVAAIDIVPISNIWQPRISAVTRLLTERIDENTPGFLVFGAQCRLLRKGFAGAYKYEQSSRGDEQGAGRILQSPLKNTYSHVHDAMQYAAIKAWELIERGGKTFESRKKINLW